MMKTLFIQPVIFHGVGQVIIIIIYPIASDSRASKEIPVHMHGN